LGPDDVDREDVPRDQPLISFPPGNRFRMSQAQVPPAAESVEVEFQAISTSPVTDAAGCRFIDLPLRIEVQQAVGELGYDCPTAIQAQIIPSVLAGRDVLAQSQTGTGKTAAFALPVLSRIELDRKAPPQVLVLAPTRELAMQVASSFEQYGRHLTSLRVATIYGGQDYELQFRQLHRSPQIVVGTPGRVIDHVHRGSLDLSQVQVLVLDEADEMLNMGFLEDVQFLLDRLPAERQINLFSATLPDPIRLIADRYLKDPVKVSIQRKTMTADSIRQRAVFVGQRDKIDALFRFLEIEATDGVIVFTKTKDATVLVADQLCASGLKAAALNGDMPQKLRERTVQQLKNGQLDVLVATDVAARGLDVPRVSHVFNFDLPHDSQSYVHRIGRTGRAGRSGEAIIFLTGAQRGKLRQIERATNQPIEVVEPPTVRQVNAHRVASFMAKIAEVIENQDLSGFEPLIEQLIQERGFAPQQVAAALAILAQQGRPFLLEEHRSRPQPASDGFDRSDSVARGERPGRSDQPGGRATKQRGGPPAPGLERFRLRIGWRDGIQPGQLVSAIARATGMAGSDIGTIHIFDSHTFIDLPEGLSTAHQRRLNQTQINGRSLRITPLVAVGGQFAGEGPSGDRPQRDRSQGDRSPGDRSPGDRSPAHRPGRPPAKGGPGKKARRPLRH
jgi:ATP-dependent RNA helicase DeaD